jgi:hypothetical protein
MSLSSRSPGKRTTCSLFPAAILSLQAAQGLWQGNPSCPQGSGTLPQIEEFNMSTFNLWGVVFQEKRDFIQLQLFLGLLVRLPVDRSPLIASS